MEYLAKLKQNLIIDMLNMQGLKKILTFNSKFYNLKIKSTNFQNFLKLICRVYNKNYQVKTGQETILRLLKTMRFIIIMKMILKSTNILELITLNLKTGETKEQLIRLKKLLLGATIAGLSPLQLLLNQHILEQLEDFYNYLHSNLSIVRAYTQAMVAQKEVQKELSNTF